MFQAARRNGLVIFLDEAQLLEDYTNDTHTKRIKQSLKSILNGTLGAPVILVAAGLSQTEAAFAKLGISRFERDCLVYLSRLGRHAAGGVLKDYLVKDGGVPRAAPSLEAWVNTIRNEADGWPQHLAAYVPLLVRYAGEHRGTLPDTVPNDLLTRGRKRKEQFYTTRLKGVGSSDRKTLAEFLLHKSRAATRSAHNNQISGTNAVITFEQNDLVQVYGERGEAMFDRLLRKGVLSERLDGDFEVPIPSMMRWLARTYGNQTGDTA